MEFYISTTFDSDAYSILCARRQRTTTIILSREVLGYVTLCWKSRRFELGIVDTPITRDRNPDYAGRHWRDRLWNDAYRELEDAVRSSQ